jgi:uncharacterized protein (DUF1778 family)
MKGKKSGTPENARNLLQVRLSESEKRNIKMIAAGQGMTLREAVLAAFTAWAEKLRAQAAAARASKAAGQK